MDTKNRQAGRNITDTKNPSMNHAAQQALFDNVARAYDTGDLLQARAFVGQCAF